MATVVFLTPNQAVLAGNARVRDAIPFDAKGRLNPDWLARVRGSRYNGPGHRTIARREARGSRARCWKPKE